MIGCLDYSAESCYGHICEMAMLEEHSLSNTDTFSVFNPYLVASVVILGGSDVEPC